MLFLGILMQAIKGTIEFCSKDRWGGTIDMRQSLSCPATQQTDFGLHKLMLCVEGASQKKGGSIFFCRRIQFVAIPSRVKARPFSFLREWGVQVGRL